MLYIRGGGGGEVCSYDRSHMYFARSRGGAFRFDLSFRMGGDLLGLGICIYIHI